MTTHIGYDTAKILKKCFGKKAPSPMECMYFVYDEESHSFEPRTRLGFCRSAPMYGVCDLISRKFCKALAEKRQHCTVLTKYEPIEALAWGISRMIQEEYYNNGLPAVEAALKEMMK